MKIYNRIITIMLVALFLSAPINASMLNSREPIIQSEREISMMTDCIYRYLDELSAYDTSYLICENADVFPLRSLYDNEADEITSLLFGLYDSNTYLGYVIIRTDDYVVLESSLGAIPYNIESSNAIRFIYDYGTYGIYDDVNDRTVYITATDYDDAQYSQFFSNTTQPIVGLSNNSQSRSNLSNVPMYLQGSYNCIVCATSRLLLYWNNNGYLGLTPTITSQGDFDSFMTTIDGYFNGHANDNIPGVILRYAATRRIGVGTSAITFTVWPYNTWDPDYSDVVNEISNGRPVLLGFAVGSDYSSSVGHMTLCVGAATRVVESDYVAVVDGHSTSIVTKLWNSTYNDFICSLSVELS